MLLEELAKRQTTPPTYDWTTYYRWYYSQLDAQDTEALGVWFCNHCLRLNRFKQEARYATCPSCKTIRPRFSSGAEATTG